MKKTIIVFIIILVGLFAFLSYMDRSGSYEIEKQLWQINQKFIRITKDPKSVPDAEYDAMANKYKKFIMSHPDSSLVKSAYVLMGRVYVTKTDYKKAREIFEEIISKYPDDIRGGVRALTEIGRTYALEKDEKNVVATYKRATDKYPLTDFGLSSPLIIAKYYSDKGKKEESKKAYNDAVSHYKALIAKYPDSIIEFQSKRLLAACYMAQGKWPESLDIFSDVLMKFSDKKHMTPQIANSILKSINTISVIQLRSVDRPIEIYTKFIETHPGHPFNKTLTAMVKAFKELKQKVEKAKLEEKKAEEASQKNAVDKQ